MPRAGWRTPSGTPIEDIVQGKVRKMTQLLLSSALLAAVPAKTVWMNEDNQHFYDHHGSEEMTAEGCRRLVDAYADTGAVTGILFCVNMQRAPYRYEHSWEGSYNYLVPEVYEHHLKLVREILSKWDMDGLELDWMRWAMHFPPGGELEGRQVLTRFVRDGRAGA